MTNEVLRRLYKDRKLLTIIKRRKLDYLGRGPKYRPLQTITYGKVEDKRRLRRKNLSWLRNIRNWTGLTVEELFRMAAYREKFKELVGFIA